MATISEAAHTDTKVVERRKALIEKFRKSTKSPKTSYAWEFYLHRVMRHFICCEPIYEPQSEAPAEIKKFNRTRIQPCEYYYELLVDFFTPEQLQAMLEHFVLHCRDPPNSHTKKVRARSIENYLQAIEQFLWINGKKGIDWDIVRSFKGEHVRAVNDREYYDDEIRKGLANTDERGRVVIRMQRQSGVRRGAETVINVEDLEPLHVDGIGKLYKMTVYRGTEAEYTTFGHPEFADEVDSYFEFRLRHGEVCRQFGTDHFHKREMYKADSKHLDPKAPVIREDFNKKDPLAARHPKRIDESSISNIITDAMVAAGVRLLKRPEGQDRHEVMATHGLRKAFKKRCRQAKIDPILLEYMMGHRSGNPKEGITKLMMTYDPEDKQELLAEFLKAIDNLSLNESHFLKQELKVKNEELANAAPKDLVADLTMTNRALGNRLDKVEDENKQLREMIKDWMQDKIKPDPGRPG